MNICKLSLLLVLSSLIIIGCKKRDHQEASDAPHASTVAYAIPQSIEIGITATFLIASETPMEFVWYTTDSKGDNFGSGFWISNYTCDPGQWKAVIGVDFPLANRPLRPVQKTSKRVSVMKDDPGPSAMEKLVAKRQAEDYATNLAKWKKSEPIKYNKHPDAPLLPNNKQDAAWEVYEYYGQLPQKKDKYRAFPNEIVELNMQKRLTKLAKYAPHMLKQNPDLLDFYVRDEAGLIPSLEFAQSLPNLNHVRTQKEREDVCKSLKMLPVYWHNFLQQIRTKGTIPPIYEVKLPTEKELTKCEHILKNRTPESPIKLRILLKPSKQ